MAAIDTDLAVVMVSVVGVVARSIDVLLFQWLFGECVMHFELLPVPLADLLKIKRIKSNQQS